MNARGVPCVGDGVVLCLSVLFLFDPLTFAFVVDLFLVVGVATRC